MASEKAASIKDATMTPSPVPASSIAEGTVEVLAGEKEVFGNGAGDVNFRNVSWQRAAIFMLKSLRRDIYGDKIEHLHELSLVTSSEWIRFRAALLEVLNRYPDVKAEVMQHLAAVGGADSASALP